MKRGFVKIWRKIKDESWYVKPSICHLAIHLILSANSSNKKIMFNKRELTIERGQFVTGRNKLSKETGLSCQQIRTGLQSLFNCGFLTIKSTNKFSIITICNYEKYQKDYSQSNQQNNQQTTSKQPQLRNKEEIKKKKRERDIKNISSPLSDELINSEKELIDLWNTAFQDEKTILKRPISLTESRKRKIRTRLKENSDKSFWLGVFKKIKQSSFCKGDNQRGWTIKFDWLIENDSNALKVLEGNYDNKLTKQKDIGNGYYS